MLEFTRYVGVYEVSATPLEPPAFKDMIINIKEHLQNLNPKSEAPSPKP